MYDTTLNSELRGFSKSADKEILEQVYSPIDREHLTATLYQNYVAWCDRGEQKKERRPEVPVSPAECKSRIIKEIGTEIGRLRSYRATEQERTEVEKLRHSVPDSPALDRLML